LDELLLARGWLFCHAGSTDGLNNCRTGTLLERHEVQVITAVLISFMGRDDGVNTILE